MKLFLCCCLLTGCAFAQAPARAIRRDSIPGLNSTDPMPTARPSNSFYRHPKDSPYVVRATLDNMPIKVPDTTTGYTMLQSITPPLQLNRPPRLSLPPSVKIIPK